MVRKVDGERRKCGDGEKDGDRDMVRKVDQESYYEKYERRMKDIEE